VIGGQLGNFITKETEEFHAKQHELKTGQILRRSWEKDDDFAARKSAFVTPAKQKATIVCDPARAQTELTRLERAYAKPVPADVPPEIAQQWREKHKLMNEYRRILRKEPINYDEPVEAAPTSDEKFQEFAEYDAAEQFAIIEVAKDPAFVRTVATHGATEKIREAAEKRLTQLSITTASSKKSAKKG
jgi:hypothetical protein